MRQQTLVILLLFGPLVLVPSAVAENRDLCTNIEGFAADPDPINNSPVMFRSCQIVLPCKVQCELVEGAVQCAFGFDCSFIPLVPCSIKCDPIPELPELEDGRICFAFRGDSILCIPLPTEDDLKELEPGPLI